MNNLLHDTLYETITLTKVKNTELGCALASGVVGFENGPTSLTCRPLSYHRKLIGQKFE